MFGAVFFSLFLLVYHRAFFWRFLFWDAHCFDVHVFARGIRKSKRRSNAESQVVKECCQHLFVCLCRFIVFIFSFSLKVSWAPSMLLYGFPRLNPPSPEVIDSTVAAGWVEKEATILLCASSEQKLARGYTYPSIENVSANFFCSKAMLRNIVSFSPATNFRTGDFCSNSIEKGAFDYGHFSAPRLLFFSTFASFPLFFFPISRMVNVRQRWVFFGLLKQTKIKNVSEFLLQELKWSSREVFPTYVRWRQPTLTPLPWLTTRARTCRHVRFLYTFYCGVWMVRAGALR